MLMISCDPSRFFLTKDRIKEYPLYTNEVYWLADIVREVIKESEVFAGFVKLYDNAEYKIVTWFAEKKPARICLDFNISYFIDVYEEAAIKECFENCVEKAVRLMVEETFFNER